MNGAATSATRQFHGAYSAPGSMREREREREREFGCEFGRGRDWFATHSALKVELRLAIRKGGLVQYSVHAS